MRSGDPGVGLGRAPQQPQGFVGSTLADPQAPELDQGVGAVAILSQRPGVVLGRLRRAARTLQSPSLLDQDVRQSLGLGRMRHTAGFMTAQLSDDYCDVAERLPLSNMMSDGGAGRRRDPPGRSAV